MQLIYSNIITILSIALHFCTINALEVNQHEMLKPYFASEFQSAITNLQDAIKKNLNVQQNKTRLAQCIAAITLTQENVELLEQAIQLFIETDSVSQEGNNEQIIAVACEGFGDSIQFGYFLKKLNEALKNAGKSEIVLHLQGGQALLLPMLQRSNVASCITTGQLEQSTTATIIPLIGAVRSDALFNVKEPYLIPNPEALAYWQQHIDPNRLNIATKWRSGNKPVLGGRMLYRDLSLKTIIDLALQVDPHAHVYLIQSPPHHNIVTQSTFEQMNEKEQQENLYNVIPDHYQQYVTQVPQSDGADHHGPFEDTLAVLALCIYVGSDTITAHMSGNVSGGQTIIILPSGNADGTSNRDWRWGQEDPQQSQTVGQITPWYNAQTFRIFEIDPNNAQELAPVAALLKKWHQH